jgi:hypothetical protein
VRHLTSVRFGSVRFGSVLGSRFGSGRRRRRATSHRLEASIDWDDCDDCDADDDDDDSRRGRASGEDDDDETRETRGDDDGEDDDAFDGTVGGTSARGTPKLGRRDDDAFDDDDANDGDDDASERWTNDHERGPDGERTTRGENRDDRYDAAERDAGFPTRGDARAKLAFRTV